VPSTRLLLAGAAALLLAGCVGGVVGQSTDVRVVNESPVRVAATVTVVDASTPLAERPVAVTYRNGTTVRVPYETHMIGIDSGPFEAPPNATDLRVLEGVERRNRTTLDPGAATTVGVRTAGLDGGEIVLMQWTRLDAGRVTWAVPIQCGDGVLTSASATVESADGSGSAGTTCQGTL
jgi:hypothetical protein